MKTETQIRAAERALLAHVNGRTFDDSAELAYSLAGVHIGFCWILGIQPIGGRLETFFRMIGSASHRDDGDDGDDKQPTDERLPQRYRYKRHDDARVWHYGVCVPCPTSPPTWQIENFSGGFSGVPYDSDPWETLGQVIGDVAAFEWIDNDNGWHQ